MISTGDVLRLHEVSIARFGGLAGPPKVGCVESALGAADNAVGYGALPNVSDRDLVLAVHLCFYLARGHCFADGNKRVAWFVLIDVLRQLGLGLGATVDGAGAFMEEVASGRHEPTAMAEWVLKYASPHE